MMLVVSIDYLYELHRRQASLTIPESEDMNLYEDVSQVRDQSFSYRIFE
jgi:hypothetical protein